MSDQLPGRPDRRRKWNRGTLIVAGTLAVAVAVSVGLLATGGHGGSATLTGEAGAPVSAPASSSSAPSSPASSAPSSPGSSSAASAPSPSSTASAPWSSTSCSSLLASWRGTGAGGQLQVVVTDVNIVTQAAASLNADLASGTAPPPADVTALSSATASLRASTQAATENPIPGCVAGANQAEVKGLTDLSDAVAGFGQAVTGAGSGDYGTARNDVQTAVTAVNSGSAEMAAAIADLNQYRTP